MKERRVLSIASAARKYDVSDDTIRRAIKRGDVAAFRIGRSVRIDADDLDRLLVPFRTAETRPAMSDRRFR